MPRRTRIENPEAIGDVTDPDFVRLPVAATIFAHRAERLRAVAPGNVLEPYLAFLAEIVETQHEVAPDIVLPPPDENALDLRFANAMPPLTDALLQDAVFDTALERFLAAFAHRAAPQAAHATRDRLTAMATDERRALAAEIFTGAYPAEQLGESLFVAASMQVLLTLHAARLPAHRIGRVAEGVCPCCGSAPVASVVVGWPGAARARYCVCSLCGTYWNHIRIKCTACASTAGISYLGIEGGDADVVGETCATCRCYIKHLHQDRSVALEPFADDVASYGLDLMLREEGFRRAAANPLFVSLGG